ncbi:MAG: hypothetical protein WKF91_00330 [Segetibacter sp.]
MIKATINSSLCCLFIFFCSFAQSQSTEWRLVKISQVYSHDNPNTSEYIYDNQGRIKAINQYYNDKVGKKWDGTVVKDFVFNKAGYITGFTSYDASGNLQYVIDYDSKTGCLSGRSIK